MIVLYIVTAAQTYVNAQNAGFKDFKKMENQKRDIFLFLSGPLRQNISSLSQAVQSTIRNEQSVLSDVPISEWK